MVQALLCKLSSLRSWESVSRRRRTAPWSRPRRPRTACACRGIPALDDAGEHGGWVVFHCAGYVQARGFKTRKGRREPTSASARVGRRIKLGCKSPGLDRPSAIFPDEERDDGAAARRVMMPGPRSVSCGELRWKRILGGRGGRAHVCVGDGSKRSGQE